MTPAECADAFGEAAVNAGNIRPVLEDFSKHMFESIGQNFAEHGRPDRWLPSQKNPDHTLIDRGDLFASANTIVEGDTDLLLVAGGNGQPPAKAPSLQFGAHLRWKARAGRFLPKKSRARKDVYKGEAELVARPYLLFQPEDLDLFYAMAWLHIFQSGGPA